MSLIKLASSSVPISRTGLQTQLTAEIAQLATHLGIQWRGGDTAIAQKVDAMSPRALACHESAFNYFAGAKKDQGITKGFGGQARCANIAQGFDTVALLKSALERLDGHSEPALQKRMPARTRSL